MSVRKWMFAGALLLAVARKLLLVSLPIVMSFTSLSISSPSPLRI